MSRTNKNVAFFKAALGQDLLNVRLIAKKLGIPKLVIHQIITETQHEGLQMCPDRA